MLFPVIGSVLPPGAGRGTELDVMPVAIQMSVPSLIIYDLVKVNYLQPSLVDIIRTHWKDGVIAEYAYKFPINLDNHHENLPRLHKYFHMWFYSNPKYQG
jgi:hypothetical protein